MISERLTPNKGWCQKSCLRLRKGRVGFGFDEEEAKLNSGRYHYYQYQYQYQYQNLCRLSLSRSSDSVVEAKVVDELELGRERKPCVSDHLQEEFELSCGYYPAKHPCCQLRL
ncbi:hypothetical protein V8G54_001249 [Vigna mungo]|uniref:Uncharacterized protein n=1 Tax=Vigna mungo TaxID=3915 RepID=A0AAQ3P7W9_VIGMU